MTPLRLDSLLAVACRGIYRAGHAIVQNRNPSMHVVEKDGNAGPQTRGDLMSQVFMMDPVLSSFPSLAPSIVGEEGSISDTKKNEYLKEAYTESDNIVCRDSQISNIIPEHFIELSEEDITIFIDPLDGTKEYLKGSDTVPMAMFGICFQHKPIAGILYQPFMNRLTLGIVDSGCYQWNSGSFDKLGPPLPTKKLVVTTTNSHFSNEIGDILTRLEADEIKREGGAGYKVLSIIEDRADVYCYPSRGTSLWDTCAPEACIIAMGGQLTDCLGEKINYNTRQRSSHENKRGVLVSRKDLDHQKMIKKLDLSSHFR